MEDRRMFRRYFNLVDRAETVLEQATAAPDRPMPAEAVAMLDDLDELVRSLEPAVARMGGHRADPQALQAELAGWVH